MHSAGHTSVPSPARASQELLLVLLAIAVAWLATRLWLYPLLEEPDNAPLILRPIVGFLAAWAVLRGAGQRWTQLGLRRPPSIVVAALATCALYAVVYWASTRLVPLLAANFPVGSGPVFLAYIRGNALALVGWLAVAWLVGGFAEELLFRGFLINRIERALGGTRVACLVAVVAQAVLFGVMHLHQGTYGFVFAGTIAVIYGVAYLALGRNLWPLILVHGTWNSVAILRLYGP